MTGTRPGDKWQKGLFWVLSACALLSPVLATAAAAPPGYGAAAARALRVPKERGTLSSFHTLATWVRKLPVGEPSLVAFAPLQASGVQLDASDSEQLQREIRSSIGAAVPLQKERIERAVTHKEARLLARQKGLPLVYLTPRWTPEELAINATLTRFSPSFWQRARNPSGTTAFEHETSAPTDALLRQYVAPSTWSNRVVRTIPNPLPQPLALSCLKTRTQSAMHAQDLLLVGRVGIMAATMDDRGLHRSANANWKDLSAIAPAPLRLPLGAVALHEQGVHVGSSDRHHSVVLDDRLALNRRLPPSYPLGGGRCADFSSRGLRTPRPCEVESDEKELEWDDVAVLDFVENSGAVTQVFAGVPLGTSSVYLSVAGPLIGTHDYELDDAAGPLALADINGDGTVELITTSASRGRADAIKIYSLTESGPRQVAGHTLPPVVALAVCPFSGANPRRIIVSTQDELWELAP